MKKHIILSLLSIIFCFSVANAQKEKAIRIGILTKLSGVEPNINYFVGYDWNLDGLYFHKLSLFSGYSFIKTDIHESKRYENGLEYSMNKNLVEKGSIRIYGGVIGRLKIENHADEPLISTSFDRTYFEAGVRAGGSLGLYWTVKNDYFINAEAAVYLLQINVVQWRVENPAIPERQRTMGGFNLNIAGNTMLKIAIGKYF